MKLIKKLFCISLIAFLILSSTSIIGLACYFHNGNAGTYDTYINASSTFTSNYYTDSNPTITYRYCNLKCDESNAKMSTALYACRIKWYSPFTTVEQKIDQIAARGLNDGTSTTWYSYTFNDVECNSVAEIQNKWTAWNFDECYNLFFEYIISDNNGEKIRNYAGQWQVICEY